MAAAPVGLVGGIAAADILGVRDTGSYAAHRLLQKVRESCFDAAALNWDRNDANGLLVNNNAFLSEGYRTSNQIAGLRFHYARASALAVLTLRSSRAMQTQSIDWLVRRAGLAAAPTPNTYVPNESLIESTIPNSEDWRSSRQVVLTDLMNLANAYRIKPNVMLSAASGYLLAKIISSRAVRDASIAGAAGHWGVIGVDGGVIYNSNPEQIATMIFGVPPQLPNMEAGFSLDYSLGTTRKNKRQSRGGGGRKRRRYNRRY